MPSPLEGEFYSTLFLVLKKERGQKPVINLKALNNYVCALHFKMEGIHTLKNLLQQEEVSFISNGGRVTLSNLSMSAIETIESILYSNISHKNKQVGKCDFLICLCLVRPMHACVTKANEIQRVKTNYKEQAGDFNVLKDPFR